MSPVAIGELARFHIEETERTDRPAVRRMQRCTGIETETSLSNPRVVSKAAISHEVFNNSDLVLRDNVAAYRNIPRGLPRFGQIIGQARRDWDEREPVLALRGDFIRLFIRAPLNSLPLRALPDARV
jgi:hypothetical protein